MTQKLVLTVEETAKKLGISRDLAYKSVNKGIIPHKRIGRRIIIPREQLLHWIENESDSII